MKKIGKISVILLAGLALAGCSQKPKQKTSSKGSATIKVTKNKKQPTKMGALIGSGFKSTKNSSSCSCICW